MLFFLLLSFWGLGSIFIIIVVAVAMRQNRLFESLYCMQWNAVFVFIFPCCFCFLSPFNFQSTRHRMLLMRWHAFYKYPTTWEIIYWFYSILPAPLLELPVIINNKIQQIYRMNILSLLSIYCCISVRVLMGTWVMLLLSADNYCKAWFLLSFISLGETEICQCNDKNNTRPKCFIPTLFIIIMIYHSLRQMVDFQIVGLLENHSFVIPGQTREYYESAYRVCY